MKFAWPIYARVIAPFPSLVKISSGCVVILESTPREEFERFPFLATGTLLTLFPESILSRELLLTFFTPNFRFTMDFWCGIILISGLPPSTYKFAFKFRANIESLDFDELSCNSWILSALLKLIFGVLIGPGWLLMSDAVRLNS
jgi:hypothetical protein